MTREAIQEIPVDKIRITNPRPRNRQTWQVIVSSIRAVGLKKPITVFRRKAPDREGNLFDLVCGEGRLLAFREIGLAAIPALVTEAPEQDQYLMSLIENIARRASSHRMLFGEIRKMRDRGYDAAAIAQKIGVDRSYIQSIVRLVDANEPTLIEAVDAGRIPVTVAVQIASGNNDEAQQALIEVYESGQIRGSKLRALRRLIKQRRAKAEGRPTNSQRQLTGPALANLYKQQVREQQRLVNRADQAKERLLIVATVMRELLKDETFVAVLQAEKLSDMPEPLALRIR
jgi:ParB family transcriptional regulator, chromosome partitioning protein